MRIRSRCALTLASDQNLVDIRFSVLWKVKDARDFLFNVADQEALVTRISESAMREIVGRTPSEEIEPAGGKSRKTRYES